MVARRRGRIDTEAQRHREARPRRKSNGERKRVEKEGVEKESERTNRRDFTTEGTETRRR
jgi:hypothetical protein